MSNSQKSISPKQRCTWPRCICKATGQYCSSKPASGPKPKKAIAKRSEKGKVKAIEKGMLLQNDAAFYLSIWMERDHIDFETGLPLYGEIRNYYFHHVLPKRPDGGYPQYRHCKWNIVLVAKDTHNKTEADMDTTPNIRTYYNKLLALHNAGELQRAHPERHIL